MMNKKGILLVIIGICLSVSVGIGLSYAFWNQTEKQEEANAYQTGCFAISLTNQENAINLSNQFPITDSEGKALVPFTFTVENTCDYYASYAINLEILAGSNMNDEYIKVMLDDNEPVRFDNSTLQEASPIESGSIKSKTLAISGVGAHKSNNHSLRIWMDENASMDAASKKLNSKIVISAVAAEPNGAQYVELLLADNHSTMVEDGTKDNNIRYIGATPNNYVKFNGEDWRIIGVFNHMWECPEDSDGTIITTDNYSTKCKQTKLLKIIRDQSIGDYSWDSTEQTVNNGYGVNEWSTSAIQTALNTAYYNSQLGTCYGNYKLSTKTCDFTESTKNPTKGLDATARSLVARVMWNTGTVDGTTKTYSNTNTKDMYTAERSDNNGKSLCTSGTYCNDSTTRTTKWIGKVGLMYPSDYGYATGGGTSGRDACLKKELYNWNRMSQCYQDDWLFNSAYQWTMTPVPDSSDDIYVFRVGSSGYVYSDNAYRAAGVRPVVYLKSSVKIIHDDEHNGSKDKPYELEF